ncbi:MAG: M50 family metallopeptidase [bacterium]|nr:M50 family metallopeptidase [bacterium]
MHIIAFILILALLVLIHELGHFIVAKKNGIKVEEFGFGFPPRIFGKKIGETLYSINLFPIGGFVKMYGEEYREMKDSNTKHTLTKDEQSAFVNKKPWQKAIVIIAGVVNNFLLAWVLISFLFTQGVPSPIDKVLIEKMLPNSPAISAGLKEKDYITSINVNNKKYEIKATTDLINLSKKFAGENIIFNVSRNNKNISINIIPRKNPPKGEGPLGIAITSFIEKKYPWYQAPFYGLIESFNITQKIVKELSGVVFQLITLQKPSADVAGPIGIAQYTGQAIKFGKNAVIELIALLSLNLAIVNILPFPALDGGRLVFVFYEWITKKRVNQKIEQYTNLFGFIVLISFAALITIHDILKLIK